MRMKKFLLVLAAMLMIFSSVAFAQKKNDSAQSNTVRIAIQPSAAFVPLYVTRYTGSLEKALATKKIKVEWQDFESGPPMNDSLSKNMSDMAVFGDVPTVGALANKVTKIKLVGIAGRGPDAYALIASKNNKSVNSVRDLRNKKVATVMGSTGHNFIKKLLESNGMSFSDVEFFNIAASSAEEALTSGEADVVAIWEPNVTRLVDKGVAKIVAEGSATDLVGVNGFVVRDEYLASNPEIVKIVLDEFQKAANSMNSLDPKVAAKIASALKIQENQLGKICKKYDYSVKITKKDVAALKDTISFLVSVRSIRAPYNVEESIDYSCQ